MADSIKCLQLDKWQNEVCIKEYEYYDEKSCEQVNPNMPIWYFVFRVSVDKDDNDKFAYLVTVEINFVQEKLLKSGHNMASYQVDDTARMQIKITPDESTVVKKDKAYMSQVVANMSDANLLEYATLLKEHCTNMDINKKEFLKHVIEWLTP